MEINIYSLLITAISTLLVGVIWFHPKVFSTTWMKESGMTEEKIMQHLLRVTKMISERFYQTKMT